MKHSRLLETEGFNQLARGRDGYCLYNRHDIYIGQSIEMYGEFSGLEAEFLEQLCVPGSIVIEVGANIGAHTVRLARRVGPQGLVLAFEPQRLVFQTLCANIALNSLANVECHWAAVGARQGSIIVPELDPDKRNNFGGLSLLNEQPGRPVSCFTLDQFISLPGVKLIKIDVEGMESEVIQGGEQLIARFKPLLYVENDRVEKSETLMRLLDGLGYRLFWHTPPLFNPANFYAEGRNLYPDISSFNMLGVHRDIKAQINGLAEITDFSLHPLRQ